MSCTLIWYLFWFYLYNDKRKTKTFVIYVIQIVLDILIRWMAVFLCFFFKSLSSQIKMYTCLLLYAMYYFLYKCKPVFLRFYIHIYLYKILFIYSICECQCWGVSFKGCFHTVKEGFKVQGCLYSVVFSHRYYWQFSNF